MMGWLYQLALRMMWRVMIYQRNKIVAPAVRYCRKIIDVGGGAYPDKRATVVVDNPALDSEQRGFMPLKSDGRFVIWDLNKYPWPFADKEFEFAICANVLEHLDNPVRACKELSRIAGRGYIEVPHWCADVLTANTDVVHKSLCSLSKGTLHNTLHFFHKASFLRRFGRCESCRLVRFLMHLNPIRLLWEDDIAACWTGVGI